MDGSGRRRETCCEVDNDIEIRPSLGRLRRAMRKRSFSVLLIRDFSRVRTFESHQRGKNWAAIVRRDLNSSGGLKREWLPHARGAIDYYKLAPVGEFIEVGADYHTSGGNLQPDRHYYLVKEVTETAVILVEISKSQIPKVDSSNQQKEEKATSH